MDYPSSITDRAFTLARAHTRVEISSLADRPYASIRNGILGGFSVLDLDSKIKYLVSDAIYHRADTLIAHTDILRSHLDESISLIGRRKMPYIPASLAYLEISAPLAANPGTYWDAVYVDLKSAYFSIYSKSGLDAQMSLTGRAYLSQGAIRPTDWPILSRPGRQQKLAKVSLYGMSRSTRLRRIVDGQLRSVYLRSSYFNPSVHGLIMLILHDIAAFAAAECSAHYIHTDGYIIPAELFPHLRDYVAEVWGLTLTHRSEIGEAEIRGLGRYRINAWASIPYYINSDIHPHEYTPWLPPALPIIKRRWQQIISSLHHPPVPPPVVIK